MTAFFRSGAPALFFVTGLSFSPRPVEVRKARPHCKSRECFDPAPCDKFLFHYISPFAVFLSKYAPYVHEKSMDYKSGKQKFFAGGGKNFFRPET